MRKAWFPSVVAGIAVAAVATACSPGATPVAPRSLQPLVSAADTPDAGPSWIAARVEQPATIEADPTDAPVFCSPCHPLVGTYINSLVAVRGGYVAVGYDQPPSHAAAWSSADAMTWKRETDLPAPDGSGISAAVSGPDGSVLAVGWRGGTAATWRTTDGAAWSP